MKGGKKLQRNTEERDQSSPNPAPPGDAVDSGGVGDEEMRISEETDKLEVAEVGGTGIEDEEGEEEDSEGDMDDERVEDDVDEGEKGKLADGYYEIEAVRRKRVRKGQFQYLIKWRGWSEAANTWEPLENLLQCSDVIDAFEESMKAGKSRSTKKRKRKASVTPVQPKKRQHHLHQQSSATGNRYDVPSSHVIRIAEEPVVSCPARQYGPSPVSKTPEGHVNNGLITSDALNQEHENGGARVAAFQLRDEKKVQEEMELKLSELKGSMVTNDNSVSPQEVVIPTGGDTVSDKVQKIYEGDSAPSSRCTGAKKRKSGSVKRFKKDSTDDPTANGAACMSIVPVDVQHQEYIGSYKNKQEDSRSWCTIIQIIKPISYKASISNSVQDVVVAFEAVRSDGTKVVVDNKFLKSNNPLLLIDFYEKHLRYSPT